jgi:hypothetical protein
VPARRFVALLLAAATGLALAYLDNRPGFDDTGVLVGLLVGAAVIVVLIGGSGSIWRAAVLGLLVGGPTPLIEIGSGGQVAAIAAPIIAIVAAVVTAVVGRAAGRAG